jgi:hypothetical protein
LDKWLAREGGGTSDGLEVRSKCSVPHRIAALPRSQRFPLRDVQVPDDTVLEPQDNASKCFGICEAEAFRRTHQLALNGKKTHPKHPLHQEDTGALSGGAGEPWLLWGASEKGSLNR